MAVYATLYSNALSCSCCSLPHDDYRHIYTVGLDRIKICPAPKCFNFSRSKLYTDLFIFFRNKHSRFVVVVVVVVVSGVVVVVSDVVVKVDADNPQFLECFYSVLLIIIKV